MGDIGVDFSSILIISRLDQDLALEESLCNALWSCVFLF